LFSSDRQERSNDRVCFRTNKQTRPSIVTKVHQKVNKTNKQSNNKTIINMGCCGPSTCFTCKDEPTSMDACMCGCAYLNGNGAIFLAQLFALLGSLLTVGSMIDCSFARIDPSVTFDLGGGLEIEATGVGFFFFQKADG
jgi:hypothetical protein